MHEHEVEINEVAHEPEAPGERVQEGLVTDVAQVVGSVAGVGSLALQTAQAFRARGEAAPQELEGAAVPADIAYRAALYEHGGLEAIDAFDAGASEYSPGMSRFDAEGYSPGFEDVDEYYGGFSVE